MTSWTRALATLPLEPGAPVFVLEVRARAPGSEWPTEWCSYLARRAKEEAEADGRRLLRDATDGREYETRITERIYGMTIYIVEVLVVGDGIGEQWSFVSAHRTQEGAALLMIQLREKDSRNQWGDVDVFRVNGPIEVMP